MADPKGNAAAGDAQKTADEIIAAAQQQAADIVAAAQRKSADEIELAKLAAADILSEATTRPAASAPTSPEHYSGKVRGSYFSTGLPQINPYDKNLRFEGAGDGISHKRVGEITAGSWLDSQLRAGVIVFRPEA